MIVLFEVLYVSFKPINLANSVIIIRLGLYVVYTRTRTKKKNSNLYADYTRVMIETVYIRIHTYIH